MDEIEGRLSPIKFPIILGHEIVGRMERLSDTASKFKKGDRGVEGKIMKIGIVPTLKIILL